MLLVPGTAQVLIRHFCYVNIYVKKLCILQHRLVPDSFYGNNLKIKQMAGFHISIIYQPCTNLTIGRKIKSLLHFPQLEMIYFQHFMRGI